MVKLSRAFPGSFSTTEAAADKQALLVELLTDPKHEWMTPESWRGGITTVCWNHPGDYLPPPAKLIESVQTEFRERLRKEQNAETLKALPSVGEQPRPYPPEAREWNEAIGRARFRKRAALMTAYRKANNTDRHSMVPESAWRGRDDPTSAEIEAVVREMRERKKIKSIGMVPELAEVAA